MGGGKKVATFKTRAEPHALDIYYRCEFCGGEGYLHNIKYHHDGTCRGCGSREFKVLRYRNIREEGYG